MVFHRLFSGAEDVWTQFAIKEQDVEILLAWYGDGEFGDEAFVLFRTISEAIESLRGAF